MIQIELLLIGAWFNVDENEKNGRYCGYILACYDKIKDEYQTVCRATIIDFNDENELIETIKELKENEIKDKPKDIKINISKSIEPDIWFKKRIIFHVIGIDISLSPTHTAAFNSIVVNNGLSLRFPRLIKCLSNISSLNNITTTDELILIYQNNNIHSHTYNCKDKH